MKQTLNEVLQTEIKFPTVYLEMWNRFSPYTMISQWHFIENLAIIQHLGTQMAGAFVECGTWKGGMSAAMMNIGGPNRDYHFFDSFEGLPPVQTIDGPAAVGWQAKTDSVEYYNNCTANYEEFRSLLAQQPIPSERVHIHRGWFKDTLKDFPRQPIATLRLDGDWYESTMECLQRLFPLVVPGGVIIIDDYQTWDGCARAVHDYLSEEGSVSRIRQTPYSGVTYLIKEDSWKEAPLLVDTDRYRGNEAYVRHGIWTFQEARSEHMFDESLAIAISQLFPQKPASMADLGCGPGFYCEYFAAKGWDAQGYEGTPGASELGHYRRIITQDLSVRDESLPKHPFVMSLEVGEHIPKEFEANFLDNVCAMAAGTLILSWAVPGQGGYGHFNEQPNDYIIQQVQARGLTLNVPASNHLREGATFRWFKNTLMVFERGKG